MVKVIGSCNNGNQTERNWQQTAEGQTSWDILNIHTLTGGGWSSQRQACWTHYEQVGVCMLGQKTNWRSWIFIQWTLVEGRDYTPLKCELAHLLDMQGLRKWCGMSRMFIPKTEGRQCVSTSVTDTVDETTVALWYLEQIYLEWQLREVKTLCWPS